MRAVARRLAGALAFAGMVAGCAVDGGAPAPGADAASPGASASTGAAARQSLAPIADPAREADRAARLAALPPISDDPRQFVGLDGLAVARRLGAPQLVRRDGPAEVWVFQGTGCTLDVFLYADEKAAGLTTRHVDLRSPAQNQTERRACLKRLLENEALRREAATS